MGESSLASKTRKPMIGRDSLMLIGSDIIAIFLAQAGCDILDKGTFNRRLWNLHSCTRRFRSFQ